jgi:hypothetical protein
MELSLDMTTRTWCGPGCQTAHPIVHVEPSDVWLLSDAGAASKDPAAPMMRIDRITGQLTARNSSGQIIEASCSLAPFRPLPNKLF